MFWTIVGAILFVILLPVILVLAGLAVFWLIILLPAVVAIGGVIVSGDPWFWAALGVYPIFWMAKDYPEWLDRREREKRDLFQPETKTERWLRELEAKQEAGLDIIAEEMGFSDLEPVARRAIAEQELKDRRHRERMKREEEEKRHKEEQGLKMVGEFRPRFEKLIDQMGFEWSVKEQDKHLVYDLGGWLVELTFEEQCLWLKEEDHFYSPMAMDIRSEDFDKIIACFVEHATPRVMKARGRRPPEP